jgi:hypothetical protein
MKFVIPLIVLALFLGRCVNDSELDNIYSFSFPTTIGKSLTYKSTCTYDDSLIGDSSIIYTTITAKKINQSGFPVYEFRDSTVLDSSWYYYYEKRPNGLYLIDAEGGGINALWKRSSLFQETKPLLLVPFSFKKGDEWSYDTLFDSVSNIKKPLKRFFQGKEKIVINQTTFDCYKFETDGYFGEKRYHYYSDNIGLVMKEIIFDSVPITAFDHVTGTIKIDRYVQERIKNQLISSN